MATEERPIPSWLTQSQEYKPQTDRDAFIVKSVLSVSSVLARLRLDDGVSSPLSPSAPIKLALGLGCILLTSLSRNYLFVLVMLACMLVRACPLPKDALSRTAATAAAAAGLTFVIMLPATLLGQPRASLTMATKALVSTGLAMEVTLTTPSAELTGALRAFRVPNLVIMTIDLTLKSIVRLGEVALEVLTALNLRSVGRNRDKQGSLGGVGGVVLVKAAEAAQQTHDAMRCRGFEGEYDAAVGWRPGGTDLVWVMAFGALMALFAYLQSQV